MRIVIVRISLIARGSAAGTAPKLTLRAAKTLSLAPDSGSGVRRDLLLF